VWSVVGATARTSSLLAMNSSCSSSDFHSLPPDLADEGPERLRNHGVHRANVSKLRRWLGLAAVAGSKKRLSAISVFADLERLSRDEPDQPAEPEDRQGDWASLGTAWACSGVLSYETRTRAFCPG
jgi:hypothetical protein